MPFPVSGTDHGLRRHRDSSSRSIDGNRYGDTGKYLTANVNLWPRPLVVFANQAAFDGLTTTQQDMLRARGRRRRTRDRPPVCACEDRESAGNLCRAGEQFVMPERGTTWPRCARAVAPVYDELRRDPDDARR